MSRVLAEFSAPWGRSLRVATAAAIAILLTVMLAGAFIAPRHVLAARAAMTLLPPLVLLGALPFMVRGYTLTETDIEIQRLGWRTVLPLAGLASVVGEPGGLRGSVRLFGNGGLFAMSGWFWNRRIGRFRAYATDPGRAVLLRYRDGRRVVLTPHDVQHFIVRVRTAAGLHANI